MMRLVIGINQAEDQHAATLIHQPHEKLYAEPPFSTHRARLKRSIVPRFSEL